MFQRIYIGKVEGTNRTILAGFCISGDSALLPLQGFQPFFTNIPAQN